MNLREIRKRKNVSQVELSYKCGISRFQIYLIDNGYVPATEEQKEKILRFLNSLEDKNIHRAGGRQ